MSMAILDAFEDRLRQVQAYLMGPNMEHDQQSFVGQRPQELMLNDQFHMQPMAMNNGMNMFVTSLPGMAGNMNMNSNNGMFEGGMTGHRAKRNSSFLSFGGRAHSIGEASYGRAMSGLSALSIDWENMDDFDLNVDHSAHINNGGRNDAPPVQAVGFAAAGAPSLNGGPNGNRNAGIRQFMGGGTPDGNSDAHVSFKL